jgi:hypothetical protein
LILFLLVELVSYSINIVTLHLVKAPILEHLILGRSNTILGIKKRACFLVAVMQLVINPSIVLADLNL